MISTHAVEHHHVEWRSRRPLLIEAAYVKARRIWPTVQLGLAAYVFAILGIPLGVTAAFHRGKLPDVLIRTFTVLWDSMPTWWTALVIIVILSATIHWFPQGQGRDGCHVDHIAGDGCEPIATRAIGDEARDRSQPVSEEFAETRGDADDRGAGAECRKELPVDAARPLIGEIGEEIGGANDEDKSERVPMQCTHPLIVPGVDD